MTDAIEVPSIPPVVKAPTYHPALDGLRGIAIALVVLFHYPWGIRDAHSPYGGNPAHGGFLGVDAFFVLSGFLITTLLLQEHARFGRISPARFLRAPRVPFAARARSAPPHRRIPALPAPGKRRESSAGQRDIRASRSTSPTGSTSTGPVRSVSRPTRGRSRSKSSSTCCSRCSLRVLLIRPRAAAHDRHRHGRGHRRVRGLARVGTGTTTSVVRRRIKSSPTPAGYNAPTCGIASTSAPTRGPTRCSSAASPRSCCSGSCPVWRRATARSSRGRPVACSS